VGSGESHMNKKLLWDKYKNKEKDAKARNLIFNLTLEEYEQLIIESNIKLEDIKINGYHLARYNDSGGYEIGNCRFVTYKENLQERKKKEHGTFFGKKHTAETKIKMSLRSKGKGEGIKNSQYGSMWIYNLEIKENKKIKKENFLLYEKQGWISGRRMIFNREA
jgi:hypothetical protein